MDGTLTFTNADDWYFVQTESGYFLQNSPERRIGTELVTGQLQVKISLPSFVRVSYVWNQAAKKGWNSTNEDSQRIILAEDCKSVMKDITAEIIGASVFPAPEREIQLLQENGLKFENAENLLLGGKNATRVRYASPTFEGFTLAVDMTRGDVVALSIGVPRGELQQYENKLLEVVKTMQYVRSASCQPR
jgi:hypothetical protein